MPATTLKKVPRRRSQTHKLACVQVIDATTETPVPGDAMFPAATSLDAMSSGGAGKGEAAGAMSTADPSTALAGASEPSEVFLEESSGSQAQLMTEMEQAKARIFGVPPPAASADVVKKTTHRFAQWLEKQQQ